MEVNSYPVIAVSPTAATANSVSASQSPGAGAILINGTLASAGVATIGAARLIRLTSGGNDSGITFTFTGTDTEGNTQTETVAGTNASNSDKELGWQIATKSDGNPFFMVLSPLFRKDEVAGLLALRLSAGLAQKKWGLTEKDFLDLKWN